MNSSPETFALLVGIITALLTAMKGIEAVSTRTQYLPFASIALGMVLSYLVAGFPVSTDPALNGLVVGLAACGLYDAASAKAKP
jgi:uncharacterized membrane protein SpoIIM required for sporulation